MECPNIDKSPKGSSNIAMNYRDWGGPVDYIFYNHKDPIGEITRVQFCKKIGRKRDVFQCLNENEWRQCRHYRAEMEHSAIGRIRTIEVSRK